MKKHYNQLPQVAFSILLALSLKPRHGYEIMKQVAEDSDGKLKLSPGTLYGSIKQMREQGFIAESSHEPVAEKRRRYYSITEEGRSSLEAELEHYERSLQLARQRKAILRKREV